MAIFNSYVSLAEGKSDVLRKSSTHLGVSPSRWWPEDKWAEKVYGPKVDAAYTIGMGKPDISVKAKVASNLMFIHKRKSAYIYTYLYIYIYIYIDIDTHTYIHT